jgi:F-type H+-transporting ATPase subunit b
LCCGMWLAAPLRAQEASPAGHAPAAHAAEAGGHGAEAGHGEAEGEAKPALLTFDPGAALWSIIVFVALLIVLRATAWKPILRVLKEREEFIEKSIADAKSEREKADQLLREYEAQLDRARVEATAIVEEGRRDAEAVRQRMLDDTRKESTELAERARREIQLAADAAIKELYDRTADLSIQIAGRVLQRELKAADHRQAIDESLAEIRKSGRAKLN